MRWSGVESATRGSEIGAWGWCVCGGGGGFWTRLQFIELDDTTDEDDEDDEDEDEDDVDEVDDFLRTVDELDAGWFWTPFWPYMPGP